MQARQKSNCLLFNIAVRDKLKMVKPERLKRGDRIAAVSLSWGGLGDEAFIHKYHIAKERMENE